MSNEGPASEASSPDGNEVGAASRDRRDSSDVVTDGAGGRTDGEGRSTVGEGSLPGVGDAALDTDGDVPDEDAEIGGQRAARVLGDETPDEPDSLDSDLEAVREAVLAEVRESLLEDPEIDAESLDISEFFDFSYLERYEEVERRWVNRPYAYVSVVYDPEEREYRYRVTEPDLDEFESYVRTDLVEYLRNTLLYKDVDSVADRREVFESEVTDIVADRARSASRLARRKLLYYLRRDFLEFGPIDPIMRDPAIEDVSCDGAGIPVFVYHRAYRDLDTNVVFEARRLSSYTVRLAQRAGKTISVSDPLLDATLPDGSRLQLTMGGEVATRGANFTIRKFSDVPFSPVDMINWNTFSLAEMVYFWLAIENNKSLIFAGGTGSGKTSSMNAISFFIPPNSKVISIEDTREVDLPHSNWIQSVTRSSTTREGRGEVTMYDLLQAALRQRPEYLLVGEIRTQERVALTFFQAMGTGHTAYTTMHADGIDTVLNRLQNPPLSVPTAMIQDLDIVSIQKQSFLGDERVRRNQTIVEVVDDQPDPTSVRTRDIFDWDAQTDTHDRVGESDVMAQVADERGWTDAELRREIDRREAVLEFLVEEDITDYRDVASVIHLYQKDPDYVLEQVRSRGYEVA
ncbi:type II/IV secretion system ATPase subunit [Haloglomus halophilum]|uniref:type II/IV secretion system ATPase subunit n=1 Tax=Haloglomus halophilum TaxID=2962672 RepID=UPI0020C99702|nr:type II/IV secretion system ATPase subunit [Haloglomus halophilum]